MVFGKNEEALKKLNNLIKSSKKNKENSLKENIDSTKSNIIRVCDIPEDKIKIGMIIRSPINPHKYGIIAEIDYPEDKYIWVLWDGEEKPCCGYYCRFCKWEVVKKRD